VKLVASIDLGTSYFKVGLFGRDGTMHGLGRVAVVKDVGDGSRPYELIFLPVLVCDYMQTYMSVGSIGFCVTALCHSFTALGIRDDCQQNVSELRWQYQETSLF
jgi:hypothetical protein